MEDIIGTWIKTVVMFNDVPHGFRVSGCTGTAIMELKMAQDIASINQDPLFLMFLDLCKEYDTLNCGQLLHNLEGYGSGMNMRGILAEFWENQEVVTRQNGYHGHNFRATHSTTQGGIELPTLFKLAVDSVVCHWLFLTVEDGSVIEDGLVQTVGWRLGVFYAEYCLMG